MGSRRMASAGRTFLLWWLTIMVSWGHITAQRELEKIYMGEILSEIPAVQCAQATPNIRISFQNRFCTKELMYETLQVAFGTQQNRLLVGLKHEGYHKFGDLTVAIGYGRFFGKRFSIALRGIYLWRHAEGYSGQHSLSLDLSAWVQTSRHTYLAFYVFNPIALKYGITGHERLPIVLKLNFGYLSEGRIGGFLFCEKRLPIGFDIGGGLICQVAKACVLNGTASLLGLSIGIQVPWRRYEFGCRVEWNYRTGISPQCQMAYHFPDAPDRAHNTTQNLKSIPK